MTLLLNDVYPLSKLCETKNCKPQSSYYYTSNNAVDYKINMDHVQSR